MTSFHFYEKIKKIENFEKNENFAKNNQKRGVKSWVLQGPPPYQPNYVTIAKKPAAQLPYSQWWLPL